MAKQTNHSETIKSNTNPPSALLIFSDGLNNLPIVVPNAGSPEADEKVMQWLERKLISRQGSKKAA